MRKLGFALLGACVLAAAPAYDPAIFGNLTWRSIGPPRGGRSITSAGSPSRPLEYYFGATGGGLWKTTDGGLTWRPVTDGQLTAPRSARSRSRNPTPTSSTSGWARPSCAATSCRATASTNPPTPARPGSTSGSATRRPSRASACIPPNPDIVYVSALGHPYGAERGARRLPLQGRRPDLEQDSLPQRPLRRRGSLPRPDESRRALRRDLGCLPHAVEPLQRRPGERPVQIHRRRRPLDRDHAQSRHARRASSARSASRFPARDSKRVYAIVENENGGVFVSDDAGATWKLTSEDRRLRQRAFYYSRIYADPKAKDTMYVLNTGFYKSTDGGKTYRTLRTPHGDNHDLWIDSDQPAAHDRKQRWRRQRLGQRRRDLDRSGVPHRAALSRRHHARHSVSRLRRAAG